MLVPCPFGGWICLVSHPLGVSGYVQGKGRVCPGDWYTRGWVYQRVGVGMSMYAQQILKHGNATGYEP